MERFKKKVAKCKPKRVQNWKSNIEKCGKFYVKWKEYEDLFNREIEKRCSKDIIYEIIKCFPEPYKYYGGNAIVELYLSNYASKSNLKGEPGVGNFAANENLSSLKPCAYKLE